MPQRLKAKPIFFGFPSDDPEQTSNFLSKLLGIDLIRTLEQGNKSYHAPISEDGIEIQVGPRHDPREGPTLYFHVDNLDDTLRQLGAQVVWGPQEIAMSEQDFPIFQEALKQVEPGTQATKSMGRAVAVLVPGGAVVGLIQLEDHAQLYFKAGKHQQALDDQQMMAYDKGREVARRVFGLQR